MFPNKYADQALAISNETIQSLESRMQEYVSKWLEDTSNRDKIDNKYKYEQPLLIYEMLV